MSTCIHECMKDSQLCPSLHPYHARKLQEYRTPAPTPKKGLIYVPLLASVYEGPSYSSFRNQIAKL